MTVISCSTLIEKKYINYVLLVFIDIYLLILINCNQLINTILRYFWVANYFINNLKISYQIIKLFYISTHIDNC